MHRRDFLKLAAAGSATLVARKAGAEEAPRVDYNTAYGVLVDTVLCIGCRKCEWACNDLHKLSNQDWNAFEDMSVFARQRRMDSRAYTVVNKIADPVKPDQKYSVKLQCMHCNHPACVSACIVGALKKDPSGPVVYDADKCIGCRYCMVACPFQVPAYEYDKPLTPEVRKCTFCHERSVKGEAPACVAICPAEALTFGKRGELLQLARERILSHPDRYVNHIYGEHEAGGTAWLYLAGVDFANTGLPGLPNTVFPERTESIQHAIFKGFIPPLALYGLLGLTMRMFKDDQPPTNHGQDGSKDHESR